MKIVRIEWLDSCQPAPEWQFLEGIASPKAHRCCTVGHLIRDDADAKVVALSVARPHGSDDWNQAGGVMVIPACSIVRMDIISCPLEQACQPSELALKRKPS